VPVHDRAAKGSLTASAISGRAVTRVKLAGRLRARSWLRWIALPCRGRRCRTVTTGGRAVRHLSPGRHAGALTLRVRRAPAVRLELRAGRRRIVQRRIVATERDDGGGTAEPEPEPEPEPEQEAPTPAPLSVTSTPGLEPAYAPEVQDYTVDCASADEVVLRVVVPPDEAISVDGAPARRGETFDQAIALEPNQAFRFTVTDASGDRSHSVRCLPPDFPSWSVERESAPQATWYAIAPTLGPGAGEYAIIADARGVPVWWMKTDGAVPLDFKVLPDGTVAWARYVGGNVIGTTYEHHSLAGESLGTIATVGVPTDHHDLQILPNGNRLLMSYVRRENVDLSSVGGPSDAAVLDGVIQEVTPDGTLEWSWNSRDHIALSETADSWGLGNTLIQTSEGPAYDLVHLNSVEADGRGLVFSARHLNAVYRLRPDGSIDWKLGGTGRPESLTLVGDPLGTASFGGQHDARILSDGTLTVFDNGTRRDRPPRAVRYALDRPTRTATMLEQVVDVRTPSSACCNSARRLSGGNWVLTNDRQGTVAELTPAGNPVLTLTFAPGVFTYRAIPYTGAELSGGALRSGMEAMHPR
jgi:hypothetical protein